MQYYEAQELMYGWHAKYAIGVSNINLSASALQSISDISLDLELGWYTAYKTEATRFIPYWGA